MVQGSIEFLQYKSATQECLIAVMSLPHKKLSDLTNYLYKYENIFSNNLTTGLCTSMHYCTTAKL
jgi:hypothetical protein